jgi:hypothetical protein
MPLRRMEIPAEEKMPTYADCGGWVISTISGWFEVIADAQNNPRPPLLCCTNDRLYTLKK